MYSKNDYRYYLENQLMHSDDFLAHYGVKGMKWNKRKKVMYDDKLHDPKMNRALAKNYSSYNISGNSINGDGKYSYKERGVESKRNPNKYVSVSKKKYDNGKRETSIYLSPTKKNHSVDLGKIKFSSSSEGSVINIDTTKKSKKNRSTKSAKKAAARRTMY